MAPQETVVVRLLGRPTIVWGATSIEPPPGKTTAMLVYLAFHGGWVGRDELLYLFWPDAPEARARGNLRPLLYRLHGVPYAQGVEREPTRVRWSVPTDLQRFRAAVAERRWLEAWEVVGGALLEGFAVAGATEFETWLETERAELRGLVHGVGVQAAGTLSARGDHPAAARVWSTLRRADPFDEEVLRSHLLSLARGGAKAEALAVFERFRAMLAEEVGSEPEPATIEAAAAIRTGGARAAGDGSGARVAVAGAAMPLQGTRFVGRRSELRALDDQLREEACRLVSIVGPGGVGKTRLAIEAAGRAAGAYPDGAHLVDLAAVTGLAGLVSAIRRSLGPGAVDEADLGELLERVRGRHMLLVLDNLEHLLDPARDVIDRILATAPAVTVLATSRVRLDLAPERLFDLPGLHYPPLGAPDATAGDHEYDAVTLFRRAANRSRAAGLGDGPDEQQDVTRVCRAVEGSPLALELAASWLRVLTLREVADELEAGSGLLEADGRRSVRHASMRTVFDDSWDLLAPAQRRALAGLSAFRGGWTREAAWAVAGVTLPGLRSVIDASLVRRLPSGRFDWHPLVGRQVLDRSRRRGREHRELEARHARYYLEMVADRSRAGFGLDGARLLSDVEADLANVQAAWRWALDHGEHDLLVASEAALHHACFGANRLAFLVGLLREAVEHPASGRRLRGVMKSTLGVTLCVGTGMPPYGPDLRGGLQLAEAGLADVEAVGPEALLQRALRWVGECQAVCGLVDGARETFTREMELLRAAGDIEGIALMRGHLAQLEPDPETAIVRLREAIAFATEVDEPCSLGNAMGALGEWLLAFEGDFHGAAAAFERASRLQERTGMHYHAFHNSLEGAGALIAAGAVEAAEAALEHARGLRDVLGPDRTAIDGAMVALVEAQLALVAGDPGTAERACRAVLAAGRDALALELRARALLASVALYRRDTDALVREVAAGGRALAALRSGAVLTPNPWTTFLAQGEVGFLDLACAAGLTEGDDTRAATLAAEALAAARASQQKPLAAVALGAALRVFDRRGDKATARRLARLLERSRETPALTRRWLHSRHGAGGAPALGAAPEPVAVPVDGLFTTAAQVASRLGLAPEAPPAVR